MRKFVSIFTLIFLVLFFQEPLMAQRKNQVRKIVIDAGHGGHDTGARGRQSKEKDVALAIALKTGQLIEHNCPGVEVVYTRKTDVFVELYRRAQIANENKADLFISIHCNANPSPFPYGTETYVMGLHKSEANLDVARAENASILLEDNYSTRYDGFDPNSPEAYIIFNLFQNAYLDKSLDFASRVEDNFRVNTKMSDRGVKQAGFLVLYRTTMPGVLIETGFLSNAKEEAYLTSSVGQDRIAYSIYRAFDEFRKNVDGNVPTVASAEDSLLKKHPAVIRLQQEKLEQALKGDTFGYRDKNKSEPTVAKKTVAEPDKTKVLNPLKSEPAQTRKEKPSPESGKPQTEKAPVVANKPEPQTPVATAASGLRFRVQFLTNPKPVADEQKQFSGIPNLKHYVQDGIYKYTAGDELTPREAELIRRLVAAHGYKDAFVLPFFNDNRIGMKEALEMIKNKQ